MIISLVQTQLLLRRLFFVNKKNIALLFGGQSAEHEVSLKTAFNIFQALDRSKYNPILIGISKQGSWFHFNDDLVFKNYSALIDTSLVNTFPEVTFIREHQGSVSLIELKGSAKTKVDAVFPALHGTLGEDGAIQGFFKILGLPFVGCGVLASSVGMDKEFMKKIFVQSDIPTPKFLSFHRLKPLSFEKIKNQLGLPFFIKPANAGSSVGVHKIQTEEDFILKTKDAFRFDHKIICEEFVDGREIECSVMGLMNEAKASQPGEVQSTHDFYSYEAKYIDANGAKIMIPAAISSEHIAEVKKIAVDAYNALNCDGLSRVDFFLRKNGELLVNEINTLPGFTQISMYPKMWEASGISYPTLVDQLIQLAFKKQDFDKQITF